MTITNSVTKLKINRTGNKVSISWNKVKGCKYKLTIKVGNKTIKKTTTKTSYSLKANAGKKVKVTFKAYKTTSKGQKTYSKITYTA